MPRPDHRGRPASGRPAVPARSARSRLERVSSLDTFLTATPIPPCHIDLDGHMECSSPHGVSDAWT